MSVRRFRDVLANKNFRLLWAGQVISNFGDRLNQMALVALVYQRAPGSELALATLISFTIIPVFVVGPVAGAWSDRLDRRKLMIVADLARALLVAFIPFCIWAGAMAPVYAIIFLTFSLGRFFLPSKMAIIPDIVPREDLLIANTLHSTTMMIGNVAGLVAAGVIVNIRGIGAAGGFFIDAGTFCVSALLIALMTPAERFREKLRSGVEMTGRALRGAARRPIMGEIRDGIAALMAYPNMRLVMAAFFVLMAALGAVSCVIIVFIQTAFGSSTRDLGFIGMFLVAGLFAGTVAFGKAGGMFPKRQALFASFIASGGAITLFALAVPRYPYLPVAGAIAAILGAVVSPIMVIVTTLTHESVPEAARGRIFSSLEMVIHLSFLVWMFLAAYAAGYVDRSWILIGAGAACALCGCAGMVFDARRATASTSGR